LGIYTHGTALNADPKAAGIANDMGIMAPLWDYDYLRFATITDCLSISMLQNNTTIGVGGRVGPIPSMASEIIPPEHLVPRIRVESADEWT
jgi:hypothetical protein